MKHISIAMNNLNLEQEVNAEHISLLENILRETRNPKIAAVLALDLLLVGVDTVSFVTALNFVSVCVCVCFIFPSKLFFCVEHMKEIFPTFTSCRPRKTKM
jgi:hypothetical protein